jgi:phosphopantothenoylcysteine decarboxylase/phosphopantothenate--cysteine ligase
VPIPPGMTLHQVESTEEMRDAVATRIADADLLVMAAAPADYRPAEVAAGKLKKTGASRTLELHETPDILATTRSRRRKGAVMVGFALETDDLLANAARKLESKGLDLIVLNDAKEPGAGFGVDTNRVTFLTRGGGEPERLALMPKGAVADAILDRAETLLNGR